MPRGKKHSEQMIAAVLAALLVGQSVSDVARQYKIDKSLVSRWRSKIPAEKLHQVATEKADDFNRLITEFLREGFKTITVQFRLFRSRKWIKAQGATELAALFGVTADKLFRILEAITVADESANKTGSVASDSPALDAPPGTSDDGLP